MEKNDDAYPRHQAVARHTRHADSKALSLGPLHGYGIGQRIMQMSEDVLRVEEGSLYPALYRVERQGWITAEWGVSENNLRAKFYKADSRRPQTARD